jgi:hypothetical protein
MDFGALLQWMNGNLKSYIVCTVANKEHMISHRTEIQKSRITYDMWLQMYKGRDVNTVTLPQHTAYRKQYDAWKNMNIHLYK